MKKLAFALVGLGLLLVAISVWADSLGFGGDSGIGATQILGALAGAVLAIVGVGLLTVDWGEQTGFRKPFWLAKIKENPALFWTLTTFLVAYIPFFLLPVFFSGLQIHYLTKYIPDAYVTQIGFDMEAIVSRIANWLTTGQSPYADGFIASPPFAIVVFSPLTLLSHPAYYKLLAGFAALAYVTVALILPGTLIPIRNHALLILFFLTGLFSYGLQFEMERGQFNLVAFAFTMFAIYIFHFHPRFRFFAYLFFSLSIQLKVYPVFFVTMLVDDWKDWRAIIKRFLGLGLVNFLLLFILGQRLFLDFVRAITEYQFLESSRVENLSIMGFAHFLSNDVFGRANLIVPAGTFETGFWLLLAVSFIIVVGHAITHKRRGLNPYLLLICTIAALVIPSVSNDYKLSLLILPVTLVFCCLHEIHPLKQKKLISLLIILASLAYWITLYPATVKPEFLGRNFPALIVILISATILNFLAPYSYEGTIQTITNPPESKQ